MNPFNLKAVVESILFVTEKPLDAGEILKVIKRAQDETAKTEEASAPGSGPDSETSLSAEDQLATLQRTEDEKLTRSDVQEAINGLAMEYQQNPDRGFVLVNVAHGFQFRSRPEWAPYLKAMNQVAPTRLSQASLETLAIVAYRQPIIRAEIDEIRGVDCGGVLKTLLDRDLVRVVGKREEPGKPLLYGTTENFLEIFNLRGLQDLPTLKDLKQIEEEMRRKESNEGETVLLEEDFFQEEQERSATPEEPFRSLEELEQEEEEAIGELEDQIKDLEAAQGKVAETLTQEKSKIPPPESLP